MVKEKSVQSIAEHDTTKIMATLGKTVVASLCADESSGINLMPQKLFLRLLEKRAKMVVKKYNDPKSFPLAAADKHGLCEWEVIIMVDLHI